MLGPRHASCFVRGIARRLTMSDISSRVKDVEYAIRGPVEDHMGELMKQLKQGKKLPFNQLIPCNIGNPYALGKPIITFPREALAIAEYPDLAKTSNFPKEVIDRALSFVNNSSCTMGAYSGVPGMEKVRVKVANFIKRRDGYDADPSQIFLTEGATSGIIDFLQIIVSGENDGVVLPIPQYPLYSALISLFGAKLVPYYLREETGWSFDSESLMASVKSAHEKGIKLKAMIVINPGNPTGTVLAESEMREIIKVCEDEGIVLLADEVYQENVYGGRRWTSFKKLVMEMKSNVQLVSFHSVSKGFLGECGHRGGYLELHNIHDDVRSQFNKILSLSICPNIAGQLLVDIMVDPPTGPVCGKLWQEERRRELASLERRAVKLHGAINKLPGLSAQKATGALYLFPKIEMTKKALEAAKKADFRGNPVSPDMFYALELMDATGIVITPGSGFGQKEGTHHFRTTFLPSEADMDEVVQRLSDFQYKFMERFA